jgi:hypothetical protein
MADRVYSEYKGWFIFEDRKGSVQYDIIMITADGEIKGHGKNEAGTRFDVAGQVKAEGSFTFDKVYPNCTIKHEGTMTGLTLAGEFWMEGAYERGTFEISPV